MSRAIFLPALLLAVLLLNACAQVSQPTSAPPFLVHTATLQPPTATPIPPTVTPLPSATPSPSPVPATELRRPAENGLDMAAQRLASPSTIDGDLSEWSAFPCHTLDQKAQVVYGDAAVWGGAADLSSNFCWGWDEDALYLAVRVNDDRLRLFPKSAGNFWETGDFIDLWIDADLVGDFNESKQDQDDFHFAFFPAPATDFSAVEILAPAFPIEERQSLSGKIQSKFQNVAAGYQGEIKIPWSVFGRVLDLQYSRLGAALVFFDNDGEQPGKEHALSTAKKLLPDLTPLFWNNLDLLAAVLPTPPAPAAEQGASYLTAIFNHLLPDKHLMLYIDCRPDYGEDAVPGIRADYLVQDGSLHYWSDKKGDKGWKWLGLVPFSNKNGMARWGVWHGWLSMCSPKDPWYVVFQRLDADWNQYYFSPALEPQNNNTYLSHTEAPLISITFNHHTPANHLFVYIDSDNKENTGNLTIFPGRGIDYIIQDDSLYKWTGLPAPNDWQWLAVVRTEQAANTSTWVFSSGYIGFPHITVTSPIKMGFSRQDASWANQFTSPILWIPEYTVVYNEPALFDITYNHTAPDDHVFVYIDSDHNATTGHTTLYSGLGVDYLLQDASLYHWTGSSWAWVASVRTVDITVQDRWVFSSSFIGDLNFPIKVAFSRQDSGWNALYTSGISSSSAYTITHTEPPPTPTPTPAPAYTFTFANNFSSGDHLFVFLDTDNSPGSGYSIGGIGANYMLQDGGLYQHTGTGWSWIPVSCTSLSFTSGPNASWIFQASCLGSPAFAYPVVFYRANSGYVGQYTSLPVIVSGYSVSHTEPPPTPTPTPAPTYTFTFNNNYAAGDHLFLFLDTDNNAGSGYVIGGIGADYMLQDGALYQSTGGPGWGWNPVGCSVSFTSGASASWNFLASCIGSPIFGYPVVFQRQNGAWVTQYTSSAVTVSGYTVTHTEPPPPPTYTFTFNNNYAAGNRLRLYLNTDNNAGTGDWIGGAEYMVEWYPTTSTVGMYQWTGSWTWISCTSLNASGTTTTVWTFQAACIGSPAFPFTANYVRMDSGWSIVYNGGPDTINAYTASHTEP